MVKYLPSSHINDSRKKWLESTSEDKGISRIIHVKNWLYLIPYKIYHLSMNLLKNWVFVLSEDSEKLAKIYQTSKY